MKKKIATVFMVVIMFITTLNLTSCQTANTQTPSQTQASYQSAGAGVLLGAVAGALLSPHNRWKGAAIGAAIGGAAGYSLAQIQAQTAQRAAQYDQPVQYQDNQGTVQAYPIGYNQYTGCKKVRVRTWQNNQLVSDIVKEECPEQ